MDACDELGMFVIVATPGWQFWNNDPVFGERVYTDIRNMVRRDRNHPSVILWEPILNETHYPDNFAAAAYGIVHEEYPFQGCYTACDQRAKGQEYFDVIYDHDINPNLNKSVFVREWGDYVDDWSAHNSPSRARRSWGEEPQLVQAGHYEKSSPTLSLEKIYAMSPQMVGGCLWAAFECNRGYHPDPFYGGIMDAFRQPKYSYYLFQSQRNPSLNVPQIENGPMIYIANELTPFSSGDVRIFSNCEEVRLLVFGQEFGTQKVASLGARMPSPAITFTNVFQFKDLKKLSGAKQWDEEKIVAEGLIGGKVVATTTRRPALRKHHLELSVDFDGTPLMADGSDIVTVVASLVDERGNVKRLGEELVVFEVEGEGRLIGSAANGANPRPLEWGTAPCLIQSTTQPGKITVRAHVLFEGITTPIGGKVTFESLPTAKPLLFSETASSVQSGGEKTAASTSNEVFDLRQKLKAAEAKINALNLKNVEKQQTSPQETVFTAGLLASSGNQRVCNGLFHRESITWRGVFVKTVEMKNTPNGG